MSALDALNDWDLARARWVLQTRVPRDRPTQLVDLDDLDWYIALYLTGIGWGKTRVGAEDISNFCRTYPGVRTGGIGATFADARDVMVEGECGLLHCVPPSCVQSWNRSLGQLLFVNGSRFDIYTAERPHKLRGPQFHRVWCDELAKWTYLGECWEILQGRLRLGGVGARPKIIVTTTPRPLALLKDLRARDNVLVITGSIFDNAANIPKAQLDELLERYEGTTIGRQELYGELLDEYEGALWTRQGIDDDRWTAGADYPPMHRKCVAVDPSTWGPELGAEHLSIGRGIETGIVAAGIDAQKPPHVQVLRDASGRMSPLQWARTAVDLYHEIGATALVVEKNNAGWVGSIIKGVDPNVHLVGVDARQAKRIRAEEALPTYEQHRVHHVGTFVELEDQMVGWDPTENWSPDRLDALVHAIKWLRPWQSRQPIAISAADHTI